MTAPSTETTMIDANRLARIAGVTERRLRQLADESVLPRPVRNRYPLVAALHALLTYYREREENHVMQEEYPTFEACSKATCIPVEVFKRAKRLRCPALRGGRVQLGPFLAWYYGGQGRAPINLEAEQVCSVALQNAKLKILIGQLKGDYITVDAVRRLGADLGRAIRKVLLMTHRLAPCLVGLPAEKIEQRLKDQEEEVLAQLDILDRTSKAWKEVADRAEQTLGGRSEAGAVAE